MAILTKYLYFKTHKKHEKGLITDSEIILISKGYMKDVNHQELIDDYEICYTITSLELKNDPRTEIDKEIERRYSSPILEKDATMLIDKKSECKQDYPAFETVPGKKYRIPHFLKVYIDEYYITLIYHLIPEDFKS